MRIALRPALLVNAAYVLSMEMASAVSLAIASERMSMPCESSMVMTGVVVPSPIKSVRPWQP